MATGEKKREEAEEEEEEDKQERQSALYASQLRNYMLAFGPCPTSVPASRPNYSPAQLREESSEILSSETFTITWA